jgi:hypothetical protein
MRRRIAPFCRRPLPLGAAAVKLMNVLYTEHELPGSALRTLFGSEFPLLLQVCTVCRPIQQPRSRRVVGA